MKIVLIVYVISWLILLAIYIASRFKKNVDSSEKQPWYLYAIIIVLAPLAVLLVPYILISSFIKKKKETKLAKEREEKEKQESAYKQRAIQDLNTALNKPQEDHSFMHAMNAQTLVDKIKEKDYDSFMQYLDHLSLPKGASLLVEECRNEGSGDISKLFVETPEGTYDLKIWDYIKAERSIDGAWDAYFLSKVWHILPLWWHANYDRRIYMYSDGDANSIHLSHENDAERNLIKKSIKPLISDPTVVKSDDRFYVQCCYWTDFGGLIRETVEVSISTEGKVSFKDIQQETLYRYECGIMY